MSFPMWLQSPRSLAVVAGVVASLANPDGASAATEEELINSPIEFACVEDRKPIEVTGYTIWAQPESVLTPQAGGDGTTVRVKVGLSLMSTSGFRHPVKFVPEDGKPKYFAVCDAEGEIGTGLEYPSLDIRIASPDVSDATLKQLTDLASLAVEKKDIAPLLFHGESADKSVWQPTSLKSGLGFGVLLNEYVSKNASPKLLNGIDWLSIATAETGATKAIEMTKARRPPAAAPTAEVQPSPAKPTGADPLAAPLDGKERSVVIAAADPALAALGLAKPNAVDTFGYCRAVEASETANSVKLEGCIPDANGIVPVRIARVGVIEIDLKAAKPNQPVTIDKQLRSPGYAVPYPAKWGNPVSEKVNVPAGDLVSLLNKPIELRAFGLSGCNASAKPKLADLLDQTLTFPEPTCAMFALTFDGAPAGAKPEITTGCRPGSNAPATTTNGVVRCIITQAGPFPKVVTVTWSPALEPISLKTAAEFPPPEMRLEVEKLLNALMLRADVVGARKPGVPTYRIADVTYQVNDKPCGKTTQLTPGKAPPSAGEAGCKTVPQGAVLALEVDTKATDPKVILDAFEEKVPYKVAFNAQPFAPFDASKARRKLPIAFSPEDQKLLTKQYSEGAEFPVKSVYVFSDAGCTPGASRVTEPFVGGARKAIHYAPVWATIVDNNNQPLTNCAEAKIARDATGPYLTFSFKSTRAVGPRRVLLLARSQDLMDVKGFPKALDKALEQFVTTAAGLYEKGAALSPVDVVTMGTDGAIKPVFTGEQAALNPQKAISEIGLIDRSGPKTPDFSLLRLDPMTKDAVRLIVVMDGSQVTEINTSHLKVLANDLQGKGSSLLQFLLTSKQCFIWGPQVPTLKCVDVGSLAGKERETALNKAFTSLLNSAGAGAEAEPDGPGGEVTGEATKPPPRNKQPNKSE